MKTGMVLLPSTRCGPRHAGHAALEADAGFASGQGPGDGWGAASSPGAVALGPFAWRPGEDGFQVCRGGVGQPVDALHAERVHEAAVLADVPDRPRPPPR